MVDHTSSRSSPPPVSPPLQMIYFQTGNTNLAAALIATGLLRYVRPVKLEKVTVFVFEDPESMGLEYERRFVRDVFPHCSPRGFSQARSFLIEEIDRLVGVEREARREPKR